MITKHSLTGNSGYSATLTGVALNLSDLEKQDIYKNGALLDSAMYSLDVVGADTVITFIEALTIFDTINIYQYASLTLSQLKRQLKIYYDYEDTALREILEDAVSYVENYTQIAMWPRSITQVVDFENDTERLSFGPVASITSVKQFEDGVFTSVDYTELDARPYYITITDIGSIRKHQIVYKVSGDFPNQCRRAALMIATDLHEKRESGDGPTKSRTRNAAHKLMDQVRELTF
jgi:hypothetical protein